MNKKVLVSVLVMTFLFFAGAAYGVHYLLGYSAVDEGEIRWGGSTTFSTRWSAAIAKWNELGTINIAPDTILTYQDLTVSDVNNSSVSWVGQYQPSAGSDTIKLNRYYLDNNTANQRQNTMMHELGHSLGLAHSISNNILYASQTSRITFGTQDTYDYYYLWGN